MTTVETEAQSFKYRKSKLKTTESTASYINMINTDNKEVQFEGIAGIRRILSVETEAAPIKEVVDSGIVNRVIDFMSWDEEPSFQIESVWILTNICAGTSQNVEYVIGLGVFDTLFDLLNSPQQTVVEQATWAIGNISGDNQEFKLFCFHKGIMDKLVEVQERFPKTEQITKNIVWIMSNLVQLKPLAGEEWEDVKKGFPLLKEVFADTTTMTESLTNAIKALSYITETYVREVVELGCVPALLKRLLDEDNQSSFVNSLKTLRHIILADDEQRNFVASSDGFLISILNFTTNGNTTIRKESYHILAKLARKNKETILLITEHQNFMKGLQKAVGGEDREVGSRACEIVDSIAEHCPPEQTLQIVLNQNFLGVLGKMLDNDELDTKQLGLMAVMKVLQSGSLVSDYNPYPFYFEEAGIADKIVLAMSLPEVGDLAMEVLNLLQILSAN